MKKFSQLAVLATLFISMLSMGFQRAKKVIFFGDSITQAGVKPGGYITLAQETLKAKGDDKNYELIGAGIGGNKVYDLYLRMDEDVMAKNPDIVVIYVGVNDVWHKASYGTGTDPDKFEKFYMAIIKKLQDKKIQVILATPAVIGERYDNSNQQDGDLNRYSQIIRDIAKKTNCKLVDLRKMFQDYEVKNNPENKESGILTADRVHLTDKGNRFVADAMLEQIVK